MKEKQIATSRLWLLPLMPTFEEPTTAQLKPEQLPYLAHPRQLPKGQFSREVAR